MRVGLLSAFATVTPGTTPLKVFPRQPFSFLKSQILDVYGRAIFRSRGSLFTSSIIHTRAVPMGPRPGQIVRRVKIARSMPRWHGGMLGALLSAFRARLAATHSGPGLDFRFLFPACSPPRIEYAVRDAIKEPFAAIFALPVRHRRCKVATRPGFIIPTLHDPVYGRRTASGTSGDFERRRWNLVLHVADRFEEIRT